MSLTTKFETYEFLLKEAEKQNKELKSLITALDERLKNQSKSLEKHREQLENMTQFAEKQTFWALQLKCELNKLNLLLTKATKIIRDFNKEYHTMMSEVSEIGYSEFNYTAEMACAINEFLSEVDLPNQLKEINEFEEKSKKANYLVGGF